MEPEQQHTHESGSDGHEAQEPLTVRSLLNDLAIALGIAVGFASLAALPVRLIVLVLLTTLLLVLFLRVAGHRPIAEVAAPFVRVTDRLDDALIDLAGASWRLIVASLLALALVTAQATEVMRDRLEPSPALDVAVVDLAIAAQQASNALRAMSARNQAISTMSLGMLRASASTRQTSDALQKMSARNLAVFQATAAALARTSQALAHPSRRAHGQTPGGPATLAAAVASARQTSDMLQKMSARSLAVFQATAAALARTSQALAVHGLVTAKRYEAVRP